MKRFARSLFALAALATAAFGQYQFDENGNGSGPNGPIPGVIGIDPLTGTNALVYDLGLN
jgi:hypothetical protein